MQVPPGAVERARRRFSAAAPPSARTRRQFRTGARPAAAIGLTLLIVLLGACLNEEPSYLVRARRFQPEAADQAPLEVGRLRFEAGFVLTPSGGPFGGLSGLSIAPDGTRMVAVSDGGLLWTAKLDHDADGRLQRIGGWEVIEPTPLAQWQRGRDRDAEALAVIGTSSLVVSLEGRHRLLLFDLEDLWAPPRELAPPPNLKPSNRGIEALAALEGGALLAIAEGIRDASGDLAAWRLTPEQIDRFSYVPVEGFVPTGADRLDDRIYVVERRFSWLSGFESRVVELPVDELAPGARLRGRELARLGPGTISENFEGIAARRAPDGRVLLYLVSDDNFFVLQQTLFLQFSVVEP